MDSEREELRMLTRGWCPAAREALEQAYARRRASGASHEAALMCALGELLP